ncbi:MAG: aconitase family protein, partial [Spirochaetales bacterium]|nr:aconitase family protein [Spirochaetales bacterium]
YEYAGEAIHALSMEERMTICNMSIEGGARVGYVNPDETTFEYLQGRRYAPKDDAFERAVEFWRGVASGDDAEYDDVFHLDADTLRPMVTWGITPGQAISVDERIPAVAELPDDQRETAEKALAHMGFAERERIKGKKIDVAFLGSCTNGRISDLREAARIVKGNKVARGVRAFVVPGSKQVSIQAEREGLPDIFRDAGFDWRGSGCSMCLGMNPDQLKGREMSASSSNRNFVGRQGSPTGRTLLMSPAMVAVAAITGEVSDAREFTHVPAQV